MHILSQRNISISMENCIKLDERLLHFPTLQSGFVRLLRSFCSRTDGYDTHCSKWHFLFGSELDKHQSADVVKIYIVKRLSRAGCIGFFHTASILISLLYLPVYILGIPLCAWLHAYGAGGSIYTPNTCHSSWKHHIHQQYHQHMGHLSAMS